VCAGQPSVPRRWPLFYPICAFFFIFFFSLSLISQPLGAAADACLDTYLMPQSSFGGHFVSVSVVSSPKEAFASACVYVLDPAHQYWAVP
jgi:hypothetical protein